MKKITQPVFAFSPRQKVRAKIQDIVFYGVVIRCIWDLGECLYLCEIWDEGKPMRFEFWADQLEAL